MTSQHPRRSITGSLILRRVGVEALPAFAFILGVPPLVRATGAARAGALNEQTPAAFRPGVRVSTLHA